MKEFLQFYHWGMMTKLHMSMYALALLFCKGVESLLRGERSIAILTMAQMVVVSFLVAVLESFLFPQDAELSPQTLRGRTILWAVVCNLGFAGGALALGWFSAVPLWGAALLIAALEGGLCAMWVGMHLARQRETKRLNDGLQRFQGTTDRP